MFYCTRPWAQCYKTIYKVTLQFILCDDFYFSLISGPKNLDRIVTKLRLKNQFAEVILLSSLFYSTWPRPKALFS